MHLLHRILDFFLPTSCSYCNTSIRDSAVPFFCSSCWADFSVISGQLCPRCGRPFESPETLVYSPDHVCLECRRKPPAYDQALSVGYFEGPLREAIHQFKYRPCRALGRHLALWMAENTSSVQGFDLIIPIPLHRSRLMQRGFNQALMLAHHLGAVLHVPLCYDNLKRIRATRPQVELSGEDRIKNVAGAFAVVRSDALQGKTILLIDDVFTTGATMNECSLVLKNSGAAGVTAFTAARVV